MGQSCCNYGALLLTITSRALHAEASHKASHPRLLHWREPVFVFKQKLVLVYFQVLQRVHDRALLKHNHGQFVMRYVFGILKLWVLKFAYGST